MEDDFDRRMAEHRARWQAGDHRRICALCEALEPAENCQDWSDTGLILFGFCPKCSKRRRLSAKDKVRIALCAESDLPQ
jgi:hypothetical protein